NASRPPMTVAISDRSNRRTNARARLSVLASMLVSWRHPARGARLVGWFWRWPGAGCRTRTTRECDGRWIEWAESQLVRCLGEDGAGCLSKADLENQLLLFG